ncbi:MAG TPA: cisplatin damage response ATP-dependent DNA ligase [Alphaproteobacteria bacterium]|nr:cisplatin damage response ATP-dependent DNA ligase [Alphaproteobacteria bacterium]
MILFSRLLDALVYMPSRNGKIRLLVDYFRTAPDPDRGWALAALTESLDIASAKPALLRDLVASRVDPELLRWSYDYVGDFAETAALIWPGRPTEEAPPTVGQIVAELGAVTKAEAPALIESWLDACTADQRYALIKLITGGMRVGVSARLAKTALAEWGGREADEIEEVWHGLEPPYAFLFDWLEGRGPRPDSEHRAAFRPLMLANPLEVEDLNGLDPTAYRAEWKWDGIRVQLVGKRRGIGDFERRIFSRSGDEVTRVFPDICEAMNFDAVLDGEMLVLRDGDVMPFNDLQQRLNRKIVTRKMLERYPAHVRLYDILFEEGEDLRGLGFEARRARLEAWYARVRPERMDLSPMVPFVGWTDLAALRDGARANGIEGLMLKRADSTYVPGRPKGPWFKWKRGALTLDCVMMYAQRGHGKRSSFYSDYTFGCWRSTPEGGQELVPVGKAYSGFTDEELGRLDRWVRAHTVNRFGPVREVEPALVLEVAFDSVHRSTRHKSGVAMRFPRIHRIRWDKPPDEADRLETLERLIVGGPAIEADLGDVRVEA